MSEKGISRTLLALAVGSLLIIGAGCQQPASQASAAEPDGNARQYGRADGTGYRRAPRGDDAAPAAPIDETGAREIKVTAKNFAFDPAEITVKKGEKIKLTLTNADGNHGIGIPAFNVNLKPGPGGTGSTVFIADQAGSFPFFCDVFCGEGHRSMRGTLIVE